MVKEKPEDPYAFMIDQLSMHPPAKNQAAAAVDAAAPEKVPAAMSPLTLVPSESAVRCVTRAVAPQPGGPPEIAIVCESSFTLVAAGPPNPAAAPGAAGPPNPRPARALAPATAPAPTAAPAAPMTPTATQRPPRPQTASGPEACVVSPDATASCKARLRGALQQVLDEEEQLRGLLEQSAGSGELDRALAESRERAAKANVRQVLEHSMDAGTLEKAIEEVELVQLGHKAFNLLLRGAKEQASASGPAGSAPQAAPAPAPAPPPREPDASLAVAPPQGTPSAQAELAQLGHKAFNLLLRGAKEQALASAPADSAPQAAPGQPAAADGAAPEAPGRLPKEQLRGLLEQSAGSGELERALAESRELAAKAIAGMQTPSNQKTNKLTSDILVNEGRAGEVMKLVACHSCLDPSKDQVRQVLEHSMDAGTLEKAIEEVKAVNLYRDVVFNGLQVDPATYRKVVFGAGAGGGCLPAPAPAPTPAREPDASLAVPAPPQGAPSAQAELGHKAFNLLLRGAKASPADSAPQAAPGQPAAADGTAPQAPRLLAREQLRGLLEQSVGSGELDRALAESRERAAKAIAGMQTAAELARLGHMAFSLLREASASGALAEHVQGMQPAKAANVRLQEALEKACLSGELEATLAELAGRSRLQESRAKLREQLEVAQISCTLDAILAEGKEEGRELQHALQSAMEAFRAGCSSGALDEALELQGGAEEESALCNLEQRQGSLEHTAMALKHKVKANARLREALESAVSGTLDPILRAAVPEPTADNARLQETLERACLYGELQAILAEQAAPTVPRQAEERAAPETPAAAAEEGEELRQALRSAVDALRAGCSSGALDEALAATPSGGPSPASVAWGLLCKAAWSGNHV